MSGETWTEYGVRLGNGLFLWSDDREEATNTAATYGGTVVGRTVTASPWLPVQEQA